MMHRQFQHYLGHLKDDLPAGIVVFLVALPLCSGYRARFRSTAVLGPDHRHRRRRGRVLGQRFATQRQRPGGRPHGDRARPRSSNSASFRDASCWRCLVAGLFQLVLGFLRAGVIGAYFPSAVIKGMLAAIGLILIMKQLPHAIGYDAALEGDETYMPLDAEGTVLDIFRVVRRDLARSDRPSVSSRS